MGSVAVEPTQSTNYRTSTTPSCRVIITSNLACIMEMRLNKRHEKRESLTPVHETVTFFSVRGVGEAAGVERFATRLAAHLICVQSPLSQQSEIGKIRFAFMYVINSAEDEAPWCCWQLRVFSEWPRVAVQHFTSLRKEEFAVHIQRGKLSARLVGRTARV